MEYINLTKENITQYMNDLVQISKMGFGERGWNEENFLLDLQGKWNLSFIAIIDKKIVGFRIATSYYYYGIETGHANYICINKDFRRIGLSLILDQHTKELCRKAGLSQITVETDEIRTPAHDLHLKMGYTQITDPIKIKEYLKSKNKLYQLKIYLKNNARVYIEYIT